MGLRLINNAAVKEKEPPSSKLLLYNYCCGLGVGGVTTSLPTSFHSASDIQ